MSYLPLQKELGDSRKLQEETFTWNKFQKCSSQCQKEDKEEYCLLFSHYQDLDLLWYVTYVFMQYEHVLCFLTHGGLKLCYNVYS